MRKNLVALALALSLCSSTALAVPPQFTLQGVLRDDTGKLQSRSANVTLTLFDALTGGNKIGGAFGPTTVVVENGLFTVSLGDATLRRQLVGVQTVFAEIAVDADVYPRQPLTSDTFALVAGTAEEADSLSSKCSGCVQDAMIASVGGAKVTGKVAAAVAADTVVDGIVATGSYLDPIWITALSGAKITGQVASARQADVAATVVDGVVATGMYVDPPWIGALSGMKILGPVASALEADAARSFTGLLNGDVVGTQGATRVAGIAGIPLANGPPRDQQFLRFDAANQQWVYATGSVTVASGAGLAGGGAVTLGGNITISNTGVLAVTGGGVIASSGGQNPQITLSGIVGIANGGTGLMAGPSAPGQYLRASDATPGAWSVGSIAIMDLPDLSGIYLTLAGNRTISGSWTFTNAITGTISNATNAANATNATSAAMFTGILGGDVTGGQSTAVVTGLQRTPVAAAVPLVNQVLQYIGGSWTPGLIVPANVAAGSYSINILGSAATAVSFTGALAGDVSGTQGAALVQGLQGRAVANTAPADAQVLTWSAATGKWQPATPPGTQGSGTCAAGYLPLGAGGRLCVSNLLRQGNYYGAGGASKTCGGEGARVCRYAEAMQSCDSGFRDSIGRDFFGGVQPGWYSDITADDTFETWNGTACPIDDNNNGVPMNASTNPQPTYYYRCCY